MPTILTKLETQFLEENKDLIADGQWEELYYKLRNSPVVIKLGDILREAGIDLLEDYHICPNGYAAFCDSFPTNLNIPEGVESIGKTAFWATNVEKVHLPSTIKAIGNGAFNRCDDLISINIPAGVEVIEENAFRRCESLKEVEFAKISKLHCIDESVFRHSGLEKITLPEGIKTIREGAFGECYFLTRIGLPESLTTIMSGAISGSQFFKRITYAGTKEQFKKITLEEGWIAYQEEIITVVCSDGLLKIVAGEVIDK